VPSGPHAGSQLPDDTDLDIDAWAGSDRAGLPPPEASAAPRPLRWGADSDLARRQASLRPARPEPDGERSSSRSPRRYATQRRRC